MGNNHDKFYPKHQRKVVLFGFPKSGKSTFLHSLQTKHLQTTITPDFQVHQLNHANLNIQIFVFFKFIRNLDQQKIKGSIGHTISLGAMQLFWQLMQVTI